MSQTTPALTTDSSGVSHLVWNQDSQIFHAYYDPRGGWVQANPIASTTADPQGGFNLQVAPVPSQPGKVVATWQEGNGNDTEIYSSVGQRTSLGDYQWSQKVNLTQDNFQDQQQGITVNSAGELVVVSQKIDREEFEADTDLYSYKLPISAELFTDDVTLDCSPIVPVTPSDPGSGTVEFPLTFDVGISSSKSQKSLFKFLPVSNNVDYEIRLRALQDQIGSGLQLQTNGEIRLSYAIPVNKINQALALTLLGYAQGIANFENNQVTSGELHLEGELDGYISFFAGEPHKIEIPVLGEAEVDLGILVELALEFVQQWQLNNASAQSTPDSFWLNLVREDGSPAQPGDDPNQLHWSVNLDQAVQSLFAPPISSQASETTTTSQINFTPALGLYGKATVKAAGLNILELDAEALGSFELSYNFSDPSNPLSKSVTESFELDGTVFGIAFHFTVEATENLSTTTSSELGYDPIAGSNTVYGDTPILGAAVSQDLTRDGPASLAVGADNTIYMAWVKEAPNGNSDLSYVLVAKSQDGGSTWSNPITIPNSAGLNLEPVIQVDGAGQVVVAWNHGSGSSLANIPPGKAYVIFGGANLSSQTSIDLKQLNGSNGFTLTGELPFSQIGYSVSEAGDVNDDGIADFLVGAPDSNIEQGQTYVVFGTKTGLGAGGTLNVSSLNGSNGFVVAGDANDQGELGDSVSQAGDINNDGIADLVVGAPSEKAGAGVAYVVFGSKTIAPGGTVNVGQLNGTTGFALTTQKTSQVATVVAGGADLNGDKIADLVLGAPGFNGEAGALYVVFGKTSLGSGGKIDLDNLGTGGFIVTTKGTNNNGAATLPLGEKASLGDVNGDSIADLLIGSKGQVVVVFGSNQIGATQTVYLDDLPPTAKLILDGRDSNAFNQLSVEPAGDINGDGSIDFIIGSPATATADGNNPGTSYVVFGGSSLTDAGTIKLDQLNGSNGFVIQGAGNAVNTAGDVNQDGFADLIIGAPGATVGTLTDAGNSYLLFGSKDLGNSGQLDLSKPLPSGQGLTLPGINPNDATTGAAVSSAGDVNQDGFADFVIGAPQSINQTILGQALADTQVYSSVSGDGGNTWSNATSVSSVTSPKQKALTTTKSGDLLLTWIVPTSNDQDQLYAAVWIDNTKSWGTPQLVTTGDIRDLDQPNAAVLSKDSSVIWTQNVLVSNNPQTYDTQLFSSRYLNGNWTPPAPLNPRDGLPVIPSSVPVSGQILYIPTEDGGVQQVSVSKVRSLETDREATVSVKRTGSLDSPLSLEYRTIDGTATAGSDYLTQEGVLEFAAGEAVKTLSIPLLDDDLAEKRQETFQIQISSSKPQAHTSFDNLHSTQVSSLTANILTIDDEPTNLAAIDSGFILDADPQAQAGNSFTPAGDVNGDGVNDFLVGAANKNSGNGAAYLVYGSKTIGVRDEFLSLDQLNSSEGVILLGANQERAGTAIASIDLNQDGQPEFLAVGAPGNPANSQAAPGKVYIIPKGNLVGQSQVNLASAATLTLTTTTNNAVGFSLATGNVNDDTVNDKPVTDLIVSAPGQNQVYVVLGQALQNQTGTLNLGNLGSNGLLLTASTGEVGQSIDTGDVNQDKIPDILIGAPQANPVVDNYQTTRGYGGQVYVVYGGKNLTGGSSLNLDQLNGSNGSVLVGQGEYNPPKGGNADLPPDFADIDSAGLSVSSAGDVNGDGYEDFLIGAPTGSPGGISTLGRAYLVFGKSGGFGKNFNLNQLDGTNGIELVGVANADGSKGGSAGTSVQKAGDLNGDKIDDLLVGAPLLNTTQDNDNNGQAYAIFGTNNWQPFLKNGTLNLSSVCADTRVFTFNNPTVKAQLGTAVSSAGDINQDSYPDIVLGSPNAGQVYVAFGHPWFGPGGSLDAQKLRSDNGFAFALPTGNSQLGTVNGGGDINGDGYTELLVGDNGPQNAGGQLFHLFFGSDPLKPNPNANQVTISTKGLGFVLGPQTLAQGDFNGDALTDFVVGTTSTTNNRLATIVFGSTDQTVWSQAPLQDLNALQTNNGGISFTLNQTNRQFTNVSSGDFNADGYEDLLLSGDTLRPFVVFGQDWSSGQVQTIAADSTLNGKQGFVLRSQYDSTSIHGLGDVNGDGIDDLAVMTNQETGTVGYVVFGGSQIGSSGVVNLDFLDGSNGFSITRDDSQPVGYAVNNAGDLNSDGYADIVIGQTPLENTGLPPSGDARAHVIYGRPKFSSSFDLSTDLDGVKGFSVKNSQTNDLTSDFGTAVSGVGDANSDGYGDLLIGAPSENAPYKGNSYLLFGAKELGNTGGVIDVASLNGKNGFAISGAEGNSFSGQYLTGTGDMNGDGFSDFSVGAKGSFNPNTGTSVGGVAFVPFGGDYSGSVNYLGDANDNVLRAVDKATINTPHVMNGKQGNDVLMSVGIDGNAGGQNQVFMLGGDGNDVLAIGDLSFGAIDGGSGTDTLKLNEFLFASESVDLTLPAVRGRIKNIEVIDLGYKDNGIKFSLPNLLALSDTTRTWKILGANGTVGAQGDNWNYQGQVTEDNITFEKYTLKNATLLIEQRITFQNIPITPTSIFGTPGDDVLEPGVTPDFQGVGERVFAGAGNDRVDVTEGSGGHHLYGGSGNDSLLASSGDWLYGGSSHDTLTASEGQGNNRLYGGSGNDQFYLGTADRAIGGAGDDQFYVLSGGKNHLRGGAGADQFWLSTGDVPESENTVVDFTPGTDVLGFGGLSINFQELTLKAEGANTLISLDDQPLAKLLGIAPTGLSASNFVFA